ncbi:ankyrin [Colletotrichum sublineola]|nr:ankyrin [Colletotrichum sublineola]
MDIWASQFRFVANDIYPKKYISRIPQRLRRRARLSLFAAAVLKRRDKLVMSLLDTQHLYRERLLAHEITAYLDRLMEDPSPYGSRPTALHVASATGLDEVVEKILKETPAEVASLDAHGRTPLCYAILCPLAAPSTVKLLLGHNANANEKTNSNGRMVPLLTYCCRLGLFSFASSLLQWGAKDDLQQLLRLALLAPSTSLRGRTSSQKAALIKKLVQCGADPNGMVRPPNAEMEERPLLFDMALTSASATRHLLAVGGVNVNMEDSSGWTALSRLLSKNHQNLKTVALLLEHGARLQPGSLNRVIENTTFRSLRELTLMLTQHEDAFNLFRLIHRHCVSRAERDSEMMSFLALFAPQSAVLAQMSDVDIRAIQRGKVGPLTLHFETVLLPLGYLS